MTDNIAGVEIAGMDNGRPEFGRLEKDGLQIVELHGHWLRERHVAYIKV